MEGGRNNNNFQTIAVSSIPKFSYSEFVLGRVLGKGGFSRVSEIREVSLALQSPNDSDEEERRLRLDLSRTCNDSATGNPRYVLKTLRPDLPKSEHTKGIVDLAVEARFLSNLSHRNIVTLRGIADTDPLESKYFVVLDFLVRTLDQKIPTWRRDVGKARGIWWCCFGYCCSNSSKLHQLWVERLSVVRDLAYAIQYLHHQDIVYRDLKPDNIGFNEEGDVKIFDFGLAKRLHPDDKTGDLYHLTGNTGSLRYMAPEVAKGLPYDKRVDAYSFGILFWQLCSLCTPYAGYSCKMHADLVVGKGRRPKLDNSWPESWNQLMRDCWSHDIHCRPNFDHIVSVLEAEISALLTDDGVLPGNLSKIKAKKKKKKNMGSHFMDVDTRLGTNEADIMTERINTPEIV